MIWFIKLDSKFSNKHASLKATLVLNSDWVTHLQVSILELVANMKNIEVGKKLVLLTGVHVVEAATKAMLPLGLCHDLWKINEQSLWSEYMLDFRRVLIATSEFQNASSIFTICCS